MAESNDEAPQATKSKSEAKAETFVEYVGTADEAKISASDWNKAKVEGNQKQVVWNADNDFKVPTSDLNAEALKVLRKDPRFKVPEA